VSALTYSFEEAVVSLRREYRSALVSVLTMTVAFITLGGFLLVTRNIEAVAERWADAAEVSVYLQDEISEASRVALQQELQAQVDVAAVEYVSKEEALRRFQVMFPELRDLAGDAARNPFPASLEVRLPVDARSAGRVQTLATLASSREGVADVQFDQQWLTRVMAVVSGMRLVSLGVGVVLLVGALFTAAAVVRLSLASRRDELDIMALVGAPTAFVRGPFVMEGMLQGGIAGFLALALLGLAYLLLETNAREPIASLFGTDGLRFLGGGAIGLLTFAGIGVGAAAGAFASRSLAMKSSP